jgi:D,D-heptose 1,7-bisphosphate phosphatase
MRATVRQMAILAGGLATRLGVISADTPKAALPIGGRPFLAWQMQEISRFGVDEILFLCGHLSDRLRDIVQSIADDLPRRLSIHFSEEPMRAGTGGALFHARAMLDERFLLCNGDSFFDTNLAALLADGAGDGPEVLARMVAREVADTSRFGLLTMDGDQVRAFSERGGAHPGLINGGIYLLDRRIVAETREICSLERDVLPRLAQAGQVRATIGAGYFIDIGIPDDLRRAERELPSVLRRRALFLDRDGTINIDYGWVGSRQRWEFVAGAEEAIRMATAAGWHVFIVTNQSGIARGFYDVADVEALHAWVGDAVRQRGGTIDDVRIAPHHPSAIRPEFRGDSDWRKPKPGMLLDLLRAWRLDPARCIMVGDQTSDIAAATAAGVAGYRFPGGNLADFVAPLLDGRND